VFCPHFGIADLPGWLYIYIYIYIYGGVRLIVGLKCNQKGGKHAGGKSREKFIVRCSK
jgi:hypothetical protein